MYPFNQAMLNHLNRQLGDDSTPSKNALLASQSVDYPRMAGQMIVTGLRIVNRGLRSLFSWNPDKS